MLHLQKGGTYSDTCSHFPVLIRPVPQWCDGQVVLGLFLWNMLHKLELFVPICHGDHNGAVWGEKRSNLSAMTTFELSGQTGGGE